MQFRCPTLNETTRFASTPQLSHQTKSFFLCPLNTIPESARQHPKLPTRYLSTYMTLERPVTTSPQLPHTFPSYPIPLHHINRSQRSIRIPPPLPRARVTSCASHYSSRDSHNKAMLDVASDTSLRAREQRSPAADSRAREGKGASTRVHTRVRVCMVSGRRSNANQCHR
jgi:hypothetical protein